MAVSKKEFLKTVIKWVRANGVPPTEGDLRAMGFTRNEFRQLFKTIQPLHHAIEAEVPLLWAKAVKTAASRSMTKRAAKGYLELVTTLSRPPTSIELGEHIGAHNRSILNDVGNIGKLYDLAVAEHPEEMAKLFTNESFTPQRLKAQAATIRNHKKFLVSTVVAGCKVDEAALKSMRQLCKLQDRLPIFLPIADPARPNHRDGHMFFDTRLKDDIFIFSDFSLNSNCYISNILTSAKQITPTSGLARIGKRTGTFIYASPKLSLESVANSHSTPLMMITPGAITAPDYATDKYMSNRTAYIATHDHTVSAILIDVVDGDLFHWRPIEFDKQGGIADLGLHYTGTGRPSRIDSVMVIPDGHIAEEDKWAVAAFAEMEAAIKPSIKVGHDTFDGFAVNSHNNNRLNTRAKQYNKAKRGMGPSMDLDVELRQYVSALNQRVRKVERFYEVASNHAERINRWVEEGRYIQDPLNYELGHEMAGYMLKGQNPLEMAAKKRGLSEKVVFLKRDESLSMHGVELGYHGDQGAHGSKGSLQQFDLTLGNCVVGHSHVARIFRRAWSVGTSSILRQNWNLGTQAWIASVVFVYANGTRQMINVIENKWRAV